jgi:hypothetical protein
VGREAAEAGNKHVYEMVGAAIGEMLDKEAKAHEAARGKLIGGDQQGFASDRLSALRPYRLAAFAALHCSKCLRAMSRGSVLSLVSLSAFDELRVEDDIDAASILDQRSAAAAPHQLLVRFSRPTGA